MIKLLGKLVSNFQGDAIQTLKRIQTAVNREINPSEDDLRKKELVTEVRRLNDFSRVASGIRISIRDIPSDPTKAFVSIDSNQKDKTGFKGFKSIDAISVDITDTSAVRSGMECLRDKFIKAGNISDVEVVRRIQNQEPARLFGLW
jgi:hypothetical protein